MKIITRVERLPFACHLSSWFSRALALLFYEVNNGPLVFVCLSNCIWGWERERVTHPLLRPLNDVTLHSGFHTLSSAAAMELSRTESHWNFWSQECAWHNHSLFGDTMVKAFFTSRVLMKIGRNEVRSRPHGSGCCWKMTEILFSVSEKIRVHT